MMGIQKPKVIGIVGGMGPEAGYALGTRILQNTPAQTDQQHLPVVLMSFPESIGDRSAFLSGDILQNPAYEIVKIILKLERSGAEVVGLACNTAHASKIYNLVLHELAQMESQVQVLNMPIETCEFIRKKHPEIRRIGLMTSNGTYHAGIYKELLRELKYEIIVPELPFQQKVIHRMIYDPNFGIKANPGKTTQEVLELLNRAIGFFRNRSTELIILGCTELPLVLPQSEIEGMLIINSLDTLAKALVREALKPQTIISHIK